MNALLRKQTFFDGVVPQWILDTDERSARLAEIFTACRLPVQAPVLDVGAGAGILLPFLKQQLHSSGQPFRAVPGSDGSTGPTARPADALPPIIELEISPEMLRMARATHGSDAGVAFVRGDAHYLPFPDAHFGSVHCFSVFPHFDHPRRALAEFRRCLRPGGTLCILHLMGHRQLNAIHRDAGRAVAEDHLPPVERLIPIVEEAGFAVSHAEERSDLYLIIAQSARAASPPHHPI